MALYRVLRTLERGNKTIPRQTLVFARDWNAGVLEKLIAVGAISPVLAPPLSELPGWTKRAGRLSAMGILTAADFLEADDAIYEEAFHVRPETIRQWRTDVTHWLTGPPEKSGG